VNGADASISRFSIGQDGALTPVDTVATGGGFLVGLRFDPNGAYLYAVDAVVNSIFQFAVATDGTLSALAPGSVPTTAEPQGPIVTAQVGSSDFAYVLNCGDQTVESFTIAANGTMTHLASVPTGSCPTGMARAGMNIYVTNTLDSTISMFAIQSDGSLAPLAQPTVPAGVAPFAMAASPDGKFAYASDPSSGDILQFNIGSDGALTPLTSQPVAAGLGPVQILVL
jgi:DNA-binding beta-propeller fold protein YncE